MPVANSKAITSSRESIVLCIVGWALRSIAAFAFVFLLVHTAGGEGFQMLLKLKWPTELLCFMVAVMVGCLSAAYPVHRSRTHQS